jgi:hypothetical protein
MEKCYEYLGCNKYRCIRHGINDSRQCWEVEGTLCNSHCIELMRKRTTGPKKEACISSNCIYFKAAKSRGIV